MTGTQQPIEGFRNERLNGLWDVGVRAIIRSVFLFLLVFCLAYSPDHARAGQSFDGLVSFYSYEGSQSASGQKIEPGALTAAHRTLPFGTRVRVSDPKTGKSVVVTINDRGPFARGRVLDVSTSAAKALDMLDKGVIHVHAEVL
jgi:rare lipoprotein A (peptidoglycan hydrolase)